MSRPLIMPSETRREAQRRSKPIVDKMTAYRRESLYGVLRSAQAKRKNRAASITLNRPCRKEKIRGRSIRRSDTASTNTRGIIVIDRVVGKKNTLCYSLSGITINAGERVAQGVFLSYDTVYHDDASGIRTGGIGSTN